MHIWHWFNGEVRLWSCQRRIFHRLVVPYLFLEEKKCITKCCVIVVVLKISSWRTILGQADKQSKNLGLLLIHSPVERPSPPTMWAGSQLSFSLTHTYTSTLTISPLCVITFSFHTHSRVVNAWLPLCLLKLKVSGASFHKASAAFFLTKFHTSLNCW